jgi:hypothetical protein
LTFRHSSRKLPLNDSSLDNPFVDPNFYAKGGKQNIRNHWNDRAAEAVGSSVEAQAAWLAEALTTATSNKDKQEIKTAQKAIGAGKSSGNTTGK